MPSASTVGVAAECDRVKQASTTTSEEQSPRKMEILKEDFVANLPMLQEAIAGCDFVAVDTELTGLATLASRPSDDFATRYIKTISDPSKYLTIQLGVCTFTWSDEIGGYEARPFNFPCFPWSADEGKGLDRQFRCQNSSLEFLLRNGFDFNKWIRHGIPYFTRAEEANFLARKAYQANAPFSNIPVTDQTRSFIENTCAKIREWMGKSTEPTLTVPAANSFFRRLVFQVVRTEFNDELHVTSNDRSMTLQQMTEELRLQREEARMPRAPGLNLRRVLDMITHSRKPLIGHNCFLDLIQITQQFLWELPQDVEMWKQLVHTEWNTVIDTKHLTGHPLVRPLLEMTDLENVSERVQKKPFTTIGPKIVMAEGFDRYSADVPVDTAENGSAEDKNDRPKYHEAGYDAYITGQAFLRFAGYILKERERLSEEEEEEHARKKRKIEEEAEDVMFANAFQAVKEGSRSNLLVVGTEKEEEEEEEEEDGEVQETPMEKNAFLENEKRAIKLNPTDDILMSEELKDYYNTLYMMRSDIALNLEGPDPEPKEKPHHFFLKNIPESFRLSTLFHLFGSFNPVEFKWVDKGVWLILPTPNWDEAPRNPPPLGRLGEEYIRTFCVGDNVVAVNGRSAGIVLEAANIEVLSWREWYEEQKQRRQQQREQQQQQEQHGSYQTQYFRVPETSTLTADGRSLDSVLPEQGIYYASGSAGTKRKYDEVVDDTN
ncbi:hypothetical protein BGZ65_002048 [Modicella reniformis]|uniref:Uncharacterized protein n=1 Tax=Modicella reniformis TaxID=1440133 RepID=A0A9P6MJ91_9FUNG|nr:hypothetical protein BGZ65_002048 [Modicella reniformis]